MAIHNNLTSLFSDIANSIRSKTGDTNAIVADTFPSVIDNISTGINIADSTLTENAQLLNGIVAYSADGTRHVGSQETVVHPAPSINKATFNTTSGNVEISANHVQTSGIVSGGTTSATTNVVIGVGAVASTITSHTATAPSVTVSHSGNIATIGTTTKPSGTAGTNYYQIGFSNSVTSGNTNARAYGNVSTNGYVTNLNNTASSWSNKAISASVTQPATYYINKGTLVAGNISGASFLENTGDYGFRATVEVPEGYHVGETVTKDFTTGIFPAPESKATANRMLTGYSLYDEDGKLVTGNMPNQGTQTSTITTQGGTYTIPEGYHDGNGVVTASIGSGAYSATQVTAVSITPNVGGTITGIATTTQPTGTDGTDYYTIDPGATYTNGNARSRINTAGYLDAGNKYVNITGSVGAGTNYYINKSVSTNSSSVSGKTVTATVTIPAGYNPGETVTVSNSVATATHPNPSINKATLNTTSGNVEITANHVQSTGYVTGGTTSASTNVSVGLGEINTPSATKAQSTPTFTWDATNRKLTASVAQTTATVYANTKTAGYVPTATRSGTVTMSASSNSYTIDAATINAPSGSAKQSKPGLSFNASNGVVTATVAATSGTAYANVTGAGYIGTGTKSGTFTMTASDSNTINVGLATLNTPSGTGSATIDSATIAYNSTAGNYDVTGSASISGTAYRNVTAAGYTATNTTSGTVSGTASLATTLPKASVTANILNSAGGSVTISRAPVLRYGGVPSGTVNAAGGAISTTAPTSGPYITVNTPANTAAAYAYIGSVTAGYTDGTLANTTIAYNSKTAGAAAMANRYIPIKVGTVTNTQGTASGATVTGSVNITQGWVEAQDISISGTVASGSATTPATTVYTGTSTLTVNNSNGYVSAPSVSGTKSVTPTVSAGYVSSGTAGTITATFNASGLQLNTKAGGTTTVTTTETTLINAGQFATGAIKAKASAGAINTPSGTASSTIGSITFGYDSTNNSYTVTGSNDITGTAYRNITTAGYLATNTTSGTVTGTANVETTLSRTNVTTTVSGTITRTAVITRRAITNTTTLLDGAAGAQTTTAPTTGVYVAANTAKNTATATATISAVTAGYSDGGNFGKTQGTKAGGAGASAMTYIPIKIGDITTTQGTASGATVTGYVEIANSGWINAQNISVSGTVASATRSAGSAAVLNNSNGNVRYYVNTTAGYTTANTSAYYLQLNTKAGGTTYVNGTGSTLVNAGQFVTSAVIAKAANVTYNTSTAGLDVPANIVIVS